MKWIDRKSRSSIVAEKVLNSVFRLEYSELTTAYISKLTVSSDFYTWLKALWALWASSKHSKLALSTLS